MTVCRATKANGEPCTLPANGSQGLCWAHDPANREKRSKMASKAARSKPSKELSVIKSEIKAAIKGVRDGTLERGRGAVCFQGFNALLKALETERRWKELDGLERRLATLEANMEGERWRA